MSRKTAGPERLAARPARSIVEHTVLNARSWSCDVCRGPLERGEPIQVTITPGGRANIVQHDPSCPPYGARIETEGGPAS